MGAAASAAAEPMSPEDLDISGYFSADVQADFVLLGDSADGGLAYYVPKFGGIAVAARNTEAPIPRFQVFERVPNHGFFAGYAMVQFGGAFDTLSYLDTLERLTSEAAAAGLRVAPAPARSAKTRISVGVDVLEGDTLAIDCEHEEVVIKRSDGTEYVVRVPRCTMLEDLGEGEPIELDSTVLWKASARSVPGNSVASTSIPFSALAMEEVNPQIRTIMAAGGQWDNIFSTNVEWEIGTVGRTRQARAIVNWKSIFEQATTYARARSWFFYDAELRTFHQDLSTCADADACGVRLEFLDEDGTWGPLAPNDPEFITKVAAFQNDIEDELFDQVDVYTRSQLGAAPSSRRYGYTLKANYEKLVLERNEVRNFIWTPERSTLRASTQLGIDCLVGGFESGRVDWDMTSAGCRAKLGQ